MRLAQCLGRRLGQAEEPDLALLHQPGHGPDRLLDRRVGIDAVEVVEVDVIDAEPLQAAVDGATDVSGAAVRLQPGPLGVVVDAELGGDEGPVAAVLQRLADQHLVGVGPVHLGGVEEGHAQLERPVDDLDGLRLVGAAVEGAHAHAAEADGGNFGTVAAQATGLHGAHPSRLSAEGGADGRAFNRPLPDLSSRSAKPGLVRSRPAASGAQCGRRGPW